MTSVEEIKALLDRLTPEERLQVNSNWRATETDSLRIQETPESESTTVVSRRAEEIKTMIDALSPIERAELNALVHDWPDDDWDKQMRGDAEAGKLDWMIEEAERSEREGTARAWPAPQE